MKTHRANKISRLAFSALIFAAGFGGARTVQAQIAAGTSSITPETQQVETGPILDVVPYVLSDGYTINLTLIPSLTDFNGYDTPPNIANVTGGLNVVQLPVILPDFTIRQVITTVNVWDNQTVVLGGLISSQVQTTRTRCRFWAICRFWENFFKARAKRIKKNLMIFVTATIVDPAGNRVHSDDELPFAQTAVPSLQPPGAGHKRKKRRKRNPAAAMSRHASRWPNRRMNSKNWQAGFSHPEEKLWTGC
jgi:Flp pilus assembly secretin CpaC